jgi:hypothetical protein
MNCHVSTAVVRSEILQAKSHQRSLLAEVSLGFQQATGYAEQMDMKQLRMTAPFTATRLFHNVG